MFCKVTGATSENFAQPGHVGLEWQHGQESLHCSFKSHHCSLCLSTRSCLPSQLGTLLASTWLVPSVTEEHRARGFLAPRLQIQHTHLGPFLRKMTLCPLSRVLGN